MSTRTQDRRRDPRVTVWSPLTLICDGVEHRAALRNLSLAGVSCTAAAELPVGRRLRLRLELRSTEDENSERIRLELTGDVVRCARTRRGAALRRYEIGVSFGTLDDVSHEALDGFLRKRLDSPGGES